MKILRAAHLGMCFGVRNAIHLALHHPEPVTVLGDLVHNENVLRDLRAQGVNIEHQVAHVTTPTVLISAHGASNRAKQQLAQRGLKVVEATCPLVLYAHLAIRKLAAAGFHPVVVGQREHVEVRGLTEDFSEFDTILTENDVGQLRPRPRFGLVAQTTQPLDRVRFLVGVLRRRFPASEVRWIDTVCQPTKQRQQAALALARQSDVVIVVGGARSNNTRELAATCRRFCDRVHHIQGPDDLCPEWLDGAQTVGLTAGTSTPDHLIQEVEDRLQCLPGESLVAAPLSQPQSRAS
jgi:4-hydroxy-3-methylbut-2-enyl diphosphate reductase